MVIADGSTIHRNSAVLCFYTGAVTSMIATDLAAVHGKGSFVESSFTNSYTSSCYVRRVGDLAAACAVTQYEICTISGVNDFFVGSGACHTMTVQTEIERVARFYIKGNVSCHIARQIDIGGIVSIVCNLTCSIPCGPCGVFTIIARVVTNIGMRCTADGVAVCCILRQRRCRRQPHHKRGCNRDC